MATLFFAPPPPTLTSHRPPAAASRPLFFLLFLLFASQVSAKASPEVGKAIKANGRAVRRLRAACEKAKRLLSMSSSAPIEVENISGDVDVNLVLTREIFESLNAALFARCLDTVGPPSRSDS